MADNSGLSRRAALRQQQEQEARQAKNRRVVGIILTAVAVAVVAILGVVVFQTLAKNAQTVGEQLTPPNATADGGINVLSTGTQAAADAPHVIVYEDYQCPACKGREAAYGGPMEELVDAGKVTLEIRTTYFLDERLGNDSSERAAIAAAAADAVGKYREYHRAVYANQPQEGRGFTDQQLRVDFPAAAGIAGEDLTKFQQLFDTWAFKDFAKKGYDAFVNNKIEATPTYVVNGTQLRFYDEAAKQVLIQPTADDLLRAITEAAGTS